MRVALGQMEVLVGQPDANFSQAAAVARAAVSGGAELLLLPELWLSGFDLSHATEYAQSFRDHFQERWADLARTSGLSMAGSVLAFDAAGRPANTAFVLSPQGETLAVYRKLHLFAPMHETAYLGAGEAASCFDLPWGRTALAVCYDLRFPELFRHYARQEALLVLVSAQWPARRIEHWRILLRARAIENQFFVAACNRAGRDQDGTVFPGHSAVIGPWGEPLVEGQETAALLLAEFDPAEVQRVRAGFPVLGDRRDGIYR